MNIEIRNDIKKICSRYEISQAELARNFGVAKMSVSFWKRGNCSRCAALLIHLLARDKIHLEEIKRATRAILLLEDCEV